MASTRSKRTRRSSRPAAPRARRLVSIIAPGTFVAALAACAGGGEPAPPGRPESRVRPEPLTPEEVGERVAQNSHRLSACYQRHRLSFGLNPLSSFRVRLRIPADGSPHVAEIVEATQKGQEPLERCVIEEMEAIEFPAHAGEPLVVDVPIRAPSR